MGSLSEEQQSLIVGTLLGDGGMRCKVNALLEINHCLKQKKYVDWKHKVLDGIVIQEPKARKGEGPRMSYRFTTKSLPELTVYYEMFYKDGVKVVPEDLQIDPMALAVWFMDDGSKSRSAVYFNTQGFGIPCQNRLLDVLQAQWGLTGSLNKDREYRRIRISTESTKRLREIIGDLVLPMFQYKFPQVTP